MALIIERVLDTRFELQYNGGNILSSDTNRLFTDGNLCHFKTGTGANIIKEQNVLFSDITVKDTFGGTGDFTFINIQSLWSKLKELKFFDGLNSGVGAGGSTTFLGLTDTPSYFGNNGKTLIANESEQKLEYTTFWNFEKFTQLNDVEIASLTEGKIVGVASVGGILKFTLIDKPASGTTYFSAVGGFDYHDLATQTTPLAYVSGDLQLTNDILGANTFLSQPPYGITSVWDEETNTFDFSQLSVGDEVLLRVHINITTTGVNQISSLRLLLGEGTANEYSLPIDLAIAEKDIASHDVIKQINFYLKNVDWRTVPAKLIFSSETNCSVKVISFHPYIIRKSINVLDVQVKGGSEKPPYELATEGQTDIIIDGSADNADIYIGSVYQKEGIDWNRFSPTIARMVNPLEANDVITKRTFTSESVKEPFTIATTGQASITLSNNARSVDVINGSVPLIENIHYTHSENIINFTLPYTVSAEDYITVRKYR